LKKTGGNATYDLGDNPGVKWYEPDTYENFGKPYTYNLTIKRWYKQAKEGF